MKRSTLQTIIGIIIALVILGYFAFADGGFLNSSKEEPVARVDGQSITAEDIAPVEQFLTEQARAEGVDVADATFVAEVRQEALRLYIQSELLYQEALSRNLAPSKEDVSSQYEEIATFAGGEEALSEQLALVGVAVDDLRSDIERDLSIQNLVDEIAPLDDIVVTEEDVEAFYAELLTLNTELPPVDEIREQLEADIRFAEQQRQVEAFVANLEAEAEIEVIEEEAQA